jgi:tetratricopeptide (TPR) repeat protein
MLTALLVSLIAAGCIPRTALTLNRTGLDYYQRGYYENAYESFSVAIGLRPDSAELYYNRANAAEKLARIKDADADFTKAIELDPGYTDAYMHRGGLSFTRRHYEAARADWSSVIGLSPDSPDAYLKRGEALERLDRIAEAGADFDRAVLLTPREPPALISRGRFYFRTGRFDHAVADLTAALTLSPESAQAYLYRGVVYEYGLSQFEAALTDYDRAVDNAPQDPYIRNYRANLLRKLGRTKDALKDFSEICRMGYPFGCWQHDWLTDETR